MNAGISEQTAQVIGEIKGLLIGVKETLQVQNESMNRRIDDMHSSNTKRLDDLNSTVSQRLDIQDDRLERVEATANRAMIKATAVETAQKAIVKKSAAGGAGIGGLVAVGIEIIKHTFWPS